MSTPGGDRQPSTVRATTTSGGKPGGKAGPKPGGPRPGPKGGKGRKITPVKVQQTRNWGPIAVAGAVVLVAGLIIGFAAWSVATSNAGDPWEERAAAIPGIDNIREKDAELVKAAQHKAGPLQYTINPPVAGQHNNAWQNCEGDVYDAPIANEHAVHSLEHGAVWITYKQGLAQDQIDKLKKRVQGVDKTMLSPAITLDKAISLQAWGYQLKVDDADDKRIDEFISALRVNASAEGPTAICSGGITATGTTPRDAPAGS